MIELTSRDASQACCTLDHWSNTPRSTVGSGLKRQVGGTGGRGWVWHLVQSAQSCAARAHGTYAVMKALAVFSIAYALLSLHRAGITHRGR